MKQKDGPGGMRPPLRRRDVIAMLGGAAAALPLRARAQQGTAPVIAYIVVRPQAAMTSLNAAFRQGLSDGGRVEGRTGPRGALMP